MLSSPTAGIDFDPWLNIIIIVMHILLYHLHRSYSVYLRRCIPAGSCPVCSSSCGKPSSSILPAGRAAPFSGSYYTRWSKCIPPAGRAALFSGSYCTRWSECILPAGRAAPLSGSYHTRWSECIPPLGGLPCSHVRIRYKMVWVHTVHWEGCAILLKFVYPTKWSECMQW